MLDLSPPEPDGLITPEVGPWSKDKHHFLRRYVDIFTTSMKKRRWKGLHYIDLFAGAGIERIREGGLDWGSPLIAAQAPNRFTQLHLCERDREKCDALRARLDRFEQPTPAQVFCDDANGIASNVVDSIPSGTLSLAFLDPTGLHLHFETLRTLAGRRVDLIIFFPDHLDALRNWQNVYAGNPDSNLSRVLGTDAWHPLMHARAPDRWAQTLREVYESQLRSIGFEYFDYERIARVAGQPLYLLMFCSAHERGGEFWRKIAARKRGGQETWEF